MIPTYILLSGLILWFVIGTKGYWPVKMALITLTVCFSMFLSRTVDDMRGWPYDGELPDEFRVHWIVVKEPSKTNTEDKGGIYIWITDFAGDGRIPRAYRSTYTKRGHENAQDALKLLKEGKMVAGGKDGREGEGEGEGEGGDGKGKGGKKGQGQGTGGGSLSNSPEIIFHELPPPKLPEKN
jgi:uncharacterized membrane protein YgcG